MVDQILALTDEGDLTEAQPNFQENGLDREKHITEIRNAERDMVMENPEQIGINFDHFDIVDARNFWPAARYQKYLEDQYGGYDNIPMVARTLIERGEAENYLLRKKEEETSKSKAFEEYLAGFEGKIEHVRVHPAGEQSPLTPSQAIEYDLDGSWRVSFTEEFVSQIKMIQERCSDITLVVQFYDHRRNPENASDIPQDPVQIEQYIALCDETVNQFGENIQLEIGNETNVSRDSGRKIAELFDHLSHYTDSVEYARFYFGVARAVKEKHPSVRLSIAGIACYDPQYLEGVLSEINRLQRENNLTMNLVDTISFHPYRDTVTDGSFEVRGGEFSLSTLTYVQQLENMQELANGYGVGLTVGEMNFNFDDQQQMKKLKEATSLTADRGVKSLIYPGVHVED